MSHAPLSSRRALLGIGVLTLSLLTACASLLGPRTVEISREELSAKLGKQFPTTKRLMRLLDVTAELPTLEMQGQRNRVLTQVQLSARELLMGQSFKGRVSLSFGLRYEPKDLSLRLTSPKVEDVFFDGLPAAYQATLTNLSARLAEDALQDHVVHQFKPEDLRTADRMGYEVKDVKVTDNGLAVYLVPRR